MNIDSRKNVKLLNQYPFANEILKIPLEPAHGNGGVGLDDLTISVQKADGDLLFRKADNIGLGDNGHTFFFEGPRKGQVGKRGEYIFAVDANGKIINRVSWPCNREEQRGQPPLYAWTVLWTGRANFGGDRDLLTVPIWNKAEYLVWVTVKAWYKGTKDMNRPFGKFVDRSMDIIIYGKPSQGFHKLQEEANVYENLYLDSNTLSQGVFDKDYDIISIGGQLGELCRLFQDDVYFNGMKEVLDKGDTREASCQLGPVKVLVAEMCGYDRVQLEDGSSWILFQLRPGAKNMYVLGVGGTLPQIRRLAKAAVKIWNEKPEIRAAFKPDGNVSVL